MAFVKDHRAFRVNPAATDSIDAGDGPPGRVKRQNTQGLTVPRDGSGNGSNRDVHSNRSPNSVGRNIMFGACEHRNKTARRWSKRCADLLATVTGMISAKLADKAWAFSLSVCGSFPKGPSVNSTSPRSMSGISIGMPVASPASRGNPKGKRSVGFVETDSCRTGGLSRWLEELIETSLNYSKANCPSLRKADMAVRSAHPGKQ